MRQWPQAKYSMEQAHLQTQALSQITYDQFLFLCPFLALPLYCSFQSPSLCFSLSNSASPSFPPSLPPSTHTCTYIHTYIHTYMHTYIHTYVHMYIHVHTYIHTKHTHTHVLFSSTFLLCYLHNTSVILQSVIFISSSSSCTSENAKSRERSIIAGRN